jgi:hypothetical protein
VKAPELLVMVAPLTEPDPSLKVPPSFQILTTLLLVAKIGSAEEVEES